MSADPIVQRFASAEIHARQLQAEARSQTAQTGIAKTLKEVNRGLGEYLGAALANKFDSIRVKVDGQVLYLKKHVKRTSNPVTHDHMARAFDTIRASDLRLEQETHPTAPPLDVLVACLLRALEDNPDLYNCSDRIVLEAAPLRTKRVVDQDCLDIRVYDAPQAIVDLARRQLELKQAKVQLDTLTRPKSRKAKEIRDASAASLDDILTIVAREEARGVHVVHVDPATGARLRLMQQTKTVKAKPLTVSLLGKSGLLKRVVESAVDPSVHGSSPEAYLQPEVRSELLAAFNFHREDHVQTNTTKVTSVRVQTLPGARPIQTGRPPPAVTKPRPRSAVPTTAATAKPRRAVTQTTVPQAAGPAKKPSARVRGGSTDKRDGDSGTPAPRKRARKPPQEVQ